VAVEKIQITQFRCERCGYPGYHGFVIGRLPLRAHPASRYGGTGHDERPNQKRNGCSPIGSPRASGPTGPAGPQGNFLAPDLLGNLPVCNSTNWGLVATQTDSAVACVLGVVATGTGSAATACEIYCQFTNTYQMGEERTIG
jgi:hypothetical protein